MKCWNIIIIILFLNIQNKNAKMWNIENSGNDLLGVWYFNGSISYNGNLYEYGIYSIINYGMEDGLIKKIELSARACNYEDSLKYKYFASVDFTEKVDNDNSSNKSDYYHTESPNFPYKYIITSEQNLNHNNETIYSGYFTRENNYNLEYLHEYIRFCCPSPYHALVNGKCVELSTENNNNDIYYVTRKFCGVLNRSNDDFETNLV